MTSYIKSAYNGVANAISSATGQLKTKVVGGSVETVEPKFEWNTGLIYSHVQGHTMARTVAVGAVSTLLIFPVLLSLIVDIGRRIAFANGHCNGKSWSLIDAAAPSVSKASQAVNTLLQPKALTPEEERQNLNLACLNTMKEQVSKIVQTYKNENGDWIRDNHTFGVRTSVQAIEERMRLHEELAETSRNFLEQNGTTETFADLSMNLTAALKKMFTDAAGNKIFVTNKTVHGGHELIREIGFKEFVLGSNGKTGAFLPKVNEAFVQITEKEFHRDYQTDGSSAPKRMIQALKSAIESHILTPAQAKNGLVQLYRAVGSKLFSQGEKETPKVLAQILNEAKKAALLTPEEVKQIRSLSKIKQSDLEDGAAKQLYDYSQKNPEGNVDKELNRIATSHVKANVLDPKEEFVFCNNVLAKFKELLASGGVSPSDSKPAVPSEFASQEFPIFAEKADEEQGISPVVAVANGVVLPTAVSSKNHNVGSVQKTKVSASEKNEVLSQSKMGPFVDDLDKILQKQRSLYEEFKNYFKLDAERKDLVSEKEKRLKETVVVTTDKGKRTMTILNAEKYYYQRLSEIDQMKGLASERLNHKNRFKAGFNEETHNLIDELKSSQDQINKMDLSLSQLFGPIKKLYGEIKGCISTYETYAKNHRPEFDALDKTAQTSITDKKKLVDKSQEQLKANLDLAEDKFNTLSFLGKDLQVQIPDTRSVFHKLWDRALGAV